MILVLSDLWLPFPGGAERLMFNLARALCRAGEDGVLAITGYHLAQPFDGPDVHHVPIQTGAELAEIIERKRRVADALDERLVILTHHYWARAYEAEIMGAGVPVVQIVLNGTRIEGAAFAVFISEHVRRAAGNARDDDLTLLPPAFPDVYAPEHEHAIGFIKPLPHKGVELVYEIAARMPEERFVILRGEWQNLEVIRPAPNIEFIEPVDDIRDFYRRVDMVLVPSLSEDAGTVGQECALNCIPCISSRAGGLPETNRGGMRMPTMDPDHWRFAIKRLRLTPWVYETVVREQNEHTPMSQPEQMAEFVRRVKLLHTP